MVLPCLTWVDPDQEPKAALVCVHGLGLNSNSYKDFGMRMSKLGYLVYAVDVPGFGSFQKAGEGRDRIDKTNFVYFLKGVKGTLELIHKINKNLPVFLLGESMGGAIAMRVTAEQPELVNGLISSVPSGDRFKAKKESIRVGLKLLTAPNKPFDIGSSVIERATESLPEGEKEKLRKEWSEDPLNRMELTPKELLAFQNFMNENFESARRITATPVLVVQGLKDKLVRPEGTEELFDHIGCKNKKLEKIEDKGHLIFEEGQFDDYVIDIVNQWLTAHVEPGKLTTK